ncbi:MAG: heat shock protein DnaJ domain protein [Rickettsiales bacterium]|jgi:DnaJ like chaperone protein|nr:heat shock protein DnaJ domain protein [Rickettsiales bacterium]
MFQRLKKAFSRFRAPKTEELLRPNPLEPIDNTPAITFIHSVVALAVKFSKSDPLQTARQIDIFATIFPIHLNQKETISLLFTDAHEDTLPAIHHARRIMRAYGKYPNVLREVLDGLVRFVLADRMITAEDMVVLDEISKVFELQKETVLYYAEKVLIPVEVSAYGVLGVEKGVGEEELKKAYRAQARNCHPDRLGENVAKELKPLLAQRFARITDAYETLLAKQRRSLVALFMSKVQGRILKNTSLGDNF